MSIPHDWETPLAEMKGVAHALDLIGEGQEDTTLREALWALGRVLKERVVRVEDVIMAMRARPAPPRLVPQEGVH